MLHYPRNENVKELLMMIEVKRGPSRGSISSKMLRRLSPSIFFTISVERVVPSQCSPSGVWLASAEYCFLLLSIFNVEWMVQYGRIHGSLRRGLLRVFALVSFHSHARSGYWQRKQLHIHTPSDSARVSLPEYLWKSNAIEYCVHHVINCSLILGKDEVFSRQESSFELM